MRGFALKAAAARICREAKARVRTNQFLRGLNLERIVDDGGRIEVIANNLFLFNGAQLAIDTTFVSACKTNGTVRQGADETDGIVLVETRKLKERIYPELTTANGRMRMVVLAIEFGGRWSREAIEFIDLLASTKARSESQLLRASIQQAWGSIS